MRCDSLEQEQAKKKGKTAPYSSYRDSEEKNQSEKKAPSVPRFDQTNPRKIGLFCFGFASPEIRQRQ